MNLDWEVIHVTMPADMQEAAITKATEASARFKIEKDIATDLKKQFDESYSGSWNCVVGTNFGVSITHETKYLKYMSRAKTHILLFRAAD